MTAIPTYTANGPRLADRRRELELAAMTILLLNVLDVLITQLILRTHPASREGNSFIAHLIMTPWIWIPKVGIPSFTLYNVARGRITQLTARGLVVVYGIYWAVIAWNLHVFLV